MLRTGPAILFTLMSAVAASAADWPQFLGPNRDGSTSETVAPWQGTLKAAWKMPVGASHSSPVVAGGVVFAFYQPAGKDADALAAFDAKSGEKLWEKSYERANFKPPFGSGPRFHAGRQRRQSLHPRRHRHPRLLGRQDRRHRLEG